MSRRLDTVELGSRSMTQFEPFTEGGSFSSICLCLRAATATTSVRLAVAKASQLADQVRMGHDDMFTLDLTVTQISAHCTSVTLSLSLCNSWTLDSLLCNLLIPSEISRTFAITPTRLSSAMR